MSFLRNSFLGVVSIQILVAWLAIDQEIHGGDVAKSLPSPWLWAAASILGGGLVGLNGARPPSATSGCAAWFSFVLFVIPFSLLLGFVREVLGTHSEPEGFWNKALHILIHGFCLSTAVLAMIRPRMKLEA